MIHVLVVQGQQGTLDPPALVRLSERFRVLYPAIAARLSMVATTVDDAEQRTLSAFTQGWPNCPPQKERQRCLEADWKCLQRRYQNMEDFCKWILSRNDGGLVIICRPYEWTAGLIQAANVVDFPPTLSELILLEFRYTSSKDTFIPRVHLLGDLATTSMPPKVLNF